MYRITSEEVQTWTRMQQEQGARSAEPPLISFPWLFQRELGKLAGARDAERGMDVMSTTADVVTPEVAKEAVRKAAAPTTAAALDDPMLIDFTAAAPSTVATPPADNDGVETATGSVMHRGDLLELFQGMELDSPALAPSSTSSSVRSQDQAQGQDEEQKQAEISTAKARKRRDSGASAGREANVEMGLDDKDNNEEMDSGEVVIMGDEDVDEDQELTAFEKLQRMLG